MIGTGGRKKCQPPELYSSRATSVNILNFTIFFQDATSISVDAKSTDYQLLTSVLNEIKDAFKSWLRFTWTLNYPATISQNYNFIFEFYLFYSFFSINEYLRARIFPCSDFSAFCYSSMNWIAMKAVPGFNRCGIEWFILGNGPKPYYAKKEIIQLCVNGFIYLRVLRLSLKSDMLEINHKLL